MSYCTKVFITCFFLLSGGLLQQSQAAGQTDSVTLYTPYTRVSVPPGESVTYSIDLINSSNKLQKADLVLTGIPRTWSYSMTSGGYAIGQLSVLPGERKSVSLKVDVPYQVNKGNYRFSLLARGITSLPLTINVSEKGTFKTEFSSDQTNMQGHSGSNFTFSGELRNRTAEKQLYALISDAAKGWQVSFKADHKQATSVEVEPNQSSKISIEVKPPTGIEAGTYEIPVRAVTSNTSAELRLQVVITGTYQIELTTPSGLLSTKSIAGEISKISLVVVNNGTTTLENIKITGTVPPRWEITFEPKEIDKLLAGNTTQVDVTIKADKKAIPGDYVANFEAKCPETSSKVSFRISVRTSMLWGWIGLFIILGALGLVYHLFRKYGRR